MKWIKKMDLKLRGNKMVITFFRRHSFLTSVSILCLVGCAKCSYIIPGLPDRSYVETADVNIGGLMSVSKYDKARPCGEQIMSPANLHYVEAINFAIRKINEDDSILKGTRLGVVLLDDCYKETTTIAQALRFVPTSNMGQDCQSLLNESLGYENTSFVSSFDVVGVIGARRSSGSIAASLLLGPTRVPLISFSSTSDELSNKEIHPYFLRVVPPDEYQARAIIDFISVHGWSYISAIYEEGSYGELGYRNIKLLADKRGVCIAVSVKLRLNLQHEGYVGVVKSLLDHPNAKVVVSFGGYSSVYGVFAAVKALKAEGKLIWIGSDTWAGIISSLPNGSRSAQGAFAMSFYSTDIPGFYEYLTNLTPNNSKNPWFPEFWESHFSCSLSEPDCESLNRLSTENDFKIIFDAAPAYDAVYTFAYAINNLVNDLCPDATGYEVSRCVRRSNKLLDYLRHTAFQGITGRIKFDAQGNLLGKYIIQQAVLVGNRMEEIPVGVYDISSGRTAFIDNITWSRFHYPDYLPWPESVCSKPCKTGEFIIRKELPCCWECRKCRENEILILDATSCEACPPFYWPDSSSNLTTCLAIPPDYIKWSSPIALIIAIFACIFIVTTLCILTFYVYNREARVIKASSRELSFVQIVSVLFGYLTILVLLDKPGRALCQAGFFLFCLSFNALYAPMFVKAVRVHRIFESGKTNKRPKYISPQCQILFSLSLIMIQIIVCISVSVISNPTAILTQPVSTKKYVELSCEMTTAGLASFLAYNLLLLSLCSVFAFKTRTLPDNFNESRFVSMCVSTTLVIWLAFMPAYFTAIQRAVQTLLLGLALLLNHNTALVFLFAPKIYAIIHEKEGQEGGNSANTLQTTATATRFAHSQSRRVNTIAPSS